MRSRISPHSTRLCVVFDNKNVPRCPSFTLKMKAPVSTTVFFLSTRLHCCASRKDSLNLLLFRQLLTALNLQTVCLKVDTIPMKDSESSLNQRPNEALLGDFVQSRGFHSTGEWRRAAGWGVTQWGGVVSEKSGTLSYIAVKTTKLSLNNQY